MPIQEVGTRAGLEEEELEFMEASFDSTQTRRYAESPSLRVERSGLLRSLHLMGMATPWVPSLWRLLLCRDPEPDRPRH